MNSSWEAGKERKDAGGFLDRPLAWCQTAARDLRGRGSVFQINKSK